MMDNLRERIARALDAEFARQAQESVHSPYVDEPYEGTITLDGTFRLPDMADAVLDIIRPYMKDGGAFEIVED